MEWNMFKSCKSSDIDLLFESMGTVLTQQEISDLLQQVRKVKAAS